MAYRLASLALSFTLGTVLLVQTAQSTQPLSPEVSASTPTRSPVEDRPFLKDGSQGDAVKQLQGMLQTLGYPLSPDGQFGRDTQLAVIDFQLKHQLQPDGSVGAQTWAVLETQIANQAPPVLPALPTLPQKLVLGDSMLPQKHPPSGWWLVLMPLVPIVGGGFSYLRRRCQAGGT